MLHFSVSLMNRLNKTGSGIFVSCMVSLHLKDLLFQNLFEKLCSIGWTLNSFAVWTDCLLIFLIGYIFVQK